MIMKSIKEQLLRNPDIQPSSDVIAKALGEANDAYIKLASELPGHDIHLEWRYYNDGKAWLGKGLHKWTGARGGQNEATVFWLSIWDSFFKSTIYFPEKARTDILSLELDDKTRQMVSDSQKMGKMKFFPVAFDFYSDEMLDAFFMLVDFRKAIR
jgi:hypothetical protein